MNTENTIPRYALFGETGSFPDILHVERFRDRAEGYEWRIEPHRHDEITQIFVMLRGKSKAKMDARSIDFQTGDILFIPPTVVHEFHFEPRVKGFVLSLPSPLVENLQPKTAPLIQALGRPSHLPMSDDMNALIDQIDQAHRGADAFRAQKLTALAHLFLLKIAEQSEAGTDARPEKLHQLDKLIGEKAAQNWAPRDYAGALSITTGQLTRICRAATGMSAQTYIESAILTEAARLLAFTQIPVAEIAYQTGFSDPAYFSRRFKKHQGSAPTTYRERFYDS